MHWYVNDVSGYCKCNSNDSCIDNNVRQEPQMKTMLGASNENNVGASNDNNVRSLK